MTEAQFRQTIHTISQPIHALALRMLRIEEDAKDAVQETIIKLWKKRNELDKINNIQAFAYTLTKNYCLDQIKKHKTLSSDDEGFLTEPINEENPQEQLEGQSTKDLIMQTINDLPELQREIIRMRDIDELEFEEIAKVLDMNTGAIRTNLSRARQRVKEQMLKFYSNERRKIKATH